MQVNFATQSYRNRSLPVSAQRMVNGYAERQPPDAKTQVAVFGAPGITAWATAGGGPIRGMHVMGGVLYVVSGGVFYSISSLGVPTFLGSIIDSGPAMVSMSDNGTQVMIVTGTSGYIWSQAAGFQVITDVNFHPAFTTTFFDDYFVLDWAGTNKFFISNILNGTVYSGLDFASAEVSSDFVVATINQQENLLIFGQRTIETWYDSGALSFPFQRYDGATIERGIIGPLTPVKEDNSVFFLGDDLIFYRLNGIIPVRISTHALESEWGTYNVTSDAYCFSYTFEGHKFVVLTFPTANHTWVYDISTNLWHERVSWDSNNNNLGRWRGSFIIYCYGMNLVGDAFSGNIGTLSPTVYTEYGNTIPMEMIAPPIHSDRKRVFHSLFELDMETGVGVTSGQGSDPQVMLDWSNDGGRTYVPLQKWTSLGRLGAYSTRVRWTRLGQSRQRVYRVTITDPVKRVVLAAHADLSVGMGMGA